MNKLETLMKCPVCQKKYSPDSASLVRQNERFMLLYVSCGGCGMGSLAVVSKDVFSREGTLTVGLLTDLDRQEVDFFSHIRPVSWDEVLDFHQGGAGLKEKNEKV